MVFNRCFLLPSLVHVEVDGDGVRDTVAGCGDDDGIIDAGIAGTAAGEGGDAAEGQEQEHRHADGSRQLAAGLAEAFG